MFAVRRTEHGVKKPLLYHLWRVLYIWILTRIVEPDGSVPLADLRPAFRMGCRVKYSPQFLQHLNSPTDRQRTRRGKVVCLMGRGLCGVLWGDSQHYEWWDAEHLAPAGLVVW